LEAKFSLPELVRDRLLRRNQNWLAILCGKTGSGKSYSAITLARKIDKDFNMDKLVFRVEDLMKLLNSGKLKRGDCIVFDEAGVGIPAREWYTISNKAIGYLLQTFRNMNLAVIFTTPNLSYIDGQARGLFHTYIETQTIDRVRKQVRARIYMMKATRKGKILYIYPRVREPGTRRKVAITKLFFPIPNKKLIRDYEKKKTQFTRFLNLSIEKSIQDMTRDARTGRPSKLPASAIAFIISASMQGVTQTNIAKLVKEKFGVSISQRGVSFVLAQSKKK